MQLQFVAKERRRLMERALAGHLHLRIGRCFGLGGVGGKCGATGGAVEVDGAR